MPNKTSPRPGNVVEALLALIDERKSTHNPRTLERYRSVMQLALGHMSHVSLRSLSPRHIEQYVAARVEAGKHNSTINQEVYILRTAARRAFPATQAFAFYRRRTEAARGIVLSQAQSVALLDALRARGTRCALALANAAQLALNTGMRSGEVRALLWSSVNLGDRWLIVERGKTERSRRRIPLNTAALAALSQQASRRTPHNDSDPVFPEMQGTCVNIPSYYPWKKVTRSIGLPMLRFHDLRHTFITRLLLSGAGDLVAKHIAGHAHDSVMRVYSHTSFAHARDAVDRLTERASTPPVAIQRQPTTKPVSIDGWDEVPI